MSEVHDLCQRIFDTPEDLDYHVANPLEDPVCRLNEGLLLLKDFNCDKNCRPFLIDFLSAAVRE
jgi:hypothetical protein